MSSFHPLEVVSRYRDPQLQMGENDTYLFYLKPNICKPRCANTHSIPNFKQSKTVFVGISGERVNTVPITSMNDIITLSSSHPLQAANCYRNSRLVVDGDDLMCFKN